MLRFRILSFQLAVSASSTLAAFSRAMSSSNVGSSKIAVAQLCSSSSKLKNLKSVAKCARLAKHENCSMLFLPECFGFMGESSEQTLAQAEPPVLDDATVNDPTITETLKSIVTSRLVDSEETDDGDSGIGIGHYKHISLLEGLRQIARASGLWISAGGMHVAGAPPEQARDRVYNTHVVLDNDGTVVGIYRKIHLFDVSIPGKVDLRESATTAAGEDLVVCDSPIGKFLEILCNAEILVAHYVRMLIDSSPGSG